MNRIKRGLSNVTDLNIALGAAMVIIAVLLIPYYGRIQEMYRMYRAGEQANQIQRAVNRYIADQQATITANTGPTTGYTLTVPMLINAGYLPPGYSAMNAFSATYRTLIFQPTASKFHTMTFMVGGSGLNLSQARDLAGFIGAAGGYIENGVAKGIQGGWQENLSAFGGYNPGDGTVVIAGFYNNGAVVNDYLYRHSVSGHPELNTMGTALNMGSNDINNANNVNGQTVNAAGDVNTARLTASQSVQSNGWINANGNLSSQSNIWAAHDIGANGNIRGSGTVSAGGDVHADANLTTSNSVYANGNVNTNGNVNAGNDVVANGTLRSNNDVIANGVFKPFQVNSAGSSCDTWGAISRDGDGATLSCQRGVWTSGGSLQQRDCYQTGNWGGRDFSEHRCPVGWYAAGLAFAGHNGNESSYVITCCH